MMKTVFELEGINLNKMLPKHDGIAEIIGERPDYIPYVKIMQENAPDLFIKDKDLERFAVNILKALKSDKLKP